MGTGNPHCIIYCSKPTLFRHTDLPPALGPEMMRILLSGVSLMSNGIKYTQKGGYVMLKVFINEKNGRMAFSVKDDGAGISDDDCERLNAALNQDESQDLMHKHFIGTGIGLSLVRNYVKMFDGDICFVSSVNCGSEFIVSFPKERVRVK